MAEKYKALSALKQSDNWKEKRKKTLIAFCLIALCLGLEYSLIFPSLWFYLHDFIQADKSKILYGSSLSAYPIASIIGAFTLGRYVDKTRNTRRVLLILLACEITGNLLYAMYFSWMCPLIGRFIAGFGDVANMVMTAEIARSYSKDEVTQKFAWLITCFSIGFIVAPGTNILFSNLHININGFIIVYANFPGLLMCAMFSIASVVTFIIVSDLSKEYDLKHICENGDSEDEIEVDEFLVSLNESSYSDTNMFRTTISIEQEKSAEIFEQIATKTYRISYPQYSKIDAEKLEKQTSVRSSQSNKLNGWQLFCQIIKIPDLTLLLTFSFVASYTLFAFDTLMSLVASHYFNFSVTETSLIFIIDGIIYTVVLVCLGKLSQVFSDFHIIIFAFSVLLLGLGSILSLSLNHANLYFSYICLIIYVLSFSSAWTIEEVLTRSLFSKLVPSSCQSYAEGLRRSVSSTAFVISGVTSSSLFNHLPYLTIVLIIFTLIILTLFIVRKKVLLYPKPLFQNISY